MFGPIMAGAVTVLFVERGHVSRVCLVCLTECRVSVSMSVSMCTCSWNVWRRELVAGVGDSRNESPA